MSRDNKEIEQKNILYLDVLRIIATLAVMMLHISGQNWAGNISYYTWMIFNFFDSITRWSVPVFVMISGVLFLNRPFGMKVIICKYIRRIAIAFLFWSMIYTLFSSLWKPGQNIITLIKEFIIGPNHMWYLYMISILYLLVPILKKISEEENLVKIFLFLGLIFGFLFPQLITVTKYVYKGLGESLEIVSNEANISTFKGYPFYFMLA